MNGGANGGGGRSRQTSHTWASYADQEEAENGDQVAGTTFPLSWKVDPSVVKSTHILYLSKSMRLLVKVQMLLCMYVL